DRFVVAVDADPEVADAVQRVDVVGVVVEKALVFLDRGFDFPLRDQLLGTCYDLISLDRHVPRRTASSADRPRQTTADEWSTARTPSGPHNDLPSHIPDCA